MFWIASLSLAMTIGVSPVHAKSPIDTDKDGLSDEQEINLYHTNPSVADTDGDGYEDGKEVQRGYDPSFPADSTKKLPKTIEINLKGQGANRDARGGPIISVLTNILLSSFGKCSSIRVIQKQRHT